MKRVLIAGASGMVGKLVLKHCLASSQVAEVISLVRRKTDQHHSKLREVVVSDFTNYSTQSVLFQGIDISFFCIGVYSGQASKEQFRAITVDYALAFAEALKANSPNARLCFLSGAGADRSEQSGMAFAKFKGMAENQISALGLKGFHAFRPGYIYPVEPRKEPSLVYGLLRFLYPVMRIMGSSGSIQSTELASAMFHVGLNGASLETLENKDILKYSP